jgi:hypothetical protein
MVRSSQRRNLLRCIVDRVVPIPKTATENCQMKRICLPADTFTDAPAVGTAANAYAARSWR